jgi:hypothetical protein
MRLLSLNLALLIFLTTCTKDRFPTPDPVGQTGVESVIYYWDFNDANTSTISAPSISIGSSEMTYSGVWDYTDGTLINALTGTTAGSCLRLRNPAGSFVIRISTLGYEKLKLSYAVMRTNNGAQENLISYSLDGINYFDAGVSPSAHGVGLEFERKEVDFSLVNALNNKSQVFIKIDFNLGNTNTTGNNRFDNITFRATNL